MEYTCINKPKVRKDARAKVTGKALYTADRNRPEFLQGRVVRSTIAHGLVKNIDISKAMEVEGVLKIITAKDYPDNRYPTCGHPYNLDPEHQDKMDKPILTDHVRYYGDEVAAVIATSKFVADKAAKLVEVEYEVWPFCLEAKDATKESAAEIHEGTKNLIGHDYYVVGEDLDKAFEESDDIVEGEFASSIVQHCHLENTVAYAYTDENDRIVVVSPTQIPHMCRRILTQAFDMPASQFRVIKPYVGGGFGNRQDVVMEPLVVAMSLSVGGKPVMLEFDREEVMIGTRTRHKFDVSIKTGVSADGKILARSAELLSNNGAYTSHGHCIVNVSAAAFIETYLDVEDMSTDLTTVYTNLPTAGAMRAYGVPQIAFPSESNLDDIAVAHGWDPLEFRLKNMQNLDHVNPQSSIKYDIRGLKQSILKGKEIIGWDKKRKEYANQTGMKRSGVGMACFTFESGTWPYRVEIGGADISLNQDGSLFVRVGATDIGQGSDTVFSQMVAESTGISYDKVRVDPITDTDINPFDTGAYSTRQSFVSGQAVKKAAEEIKGKILARAEKMLSIGREVLDVENDYVVRDLTREKLLSVADLAMHSYYDTQGAQVITSSVSNSVHSNAVTMGVGFADITVDIGTGKVEINQILNVHDCGTVLNPVTAAGQVHGGMSMGLGYALSENMIFDKKTGRALNNNLLDYKLPTLMDTPELTAAFVEIHNENGPYGNKGLGEPPTIPVAPAIRNAILHATGVGVNKLPMNPQTLFEHFRVAGLV